jgi:ABC-type dipeptide/oligopeptide/nickel transport system permease subunit
MLRELFEYMLTHKKWWMLPPVIVLVLFGVMLAVSASSPVSPLIYALF